MVEDVRDFTAISTAVGATLAERLEKFGVRIESVEIQSIDYPDHVRKEIQARTQQKQKQLTEIKKMDDQMAKEKKQIELQHIIAERERSQANHTAKLREMELEAEGKHVQKEAKVCSSTPFHINHT